MVKRVQLTTQEGKKAVCYVPENRGARFAVYPTDGRARDAEVQSADWPVTLTLSGESGLFTWFTHGFQLRIVDGMPLLWLAEPLAAACRGIVICEPVVEEGRIVGGKYSRQQANRVLQRPEYADAVARAAAVARATAYAADPANYALFRANFDKAKLATTKLGKAVLLREDEVTARIKGLHSSVVDVAFPAAAAPRVERSIARARATAQAQRAALQAVEDSAAASATGATSDAKDKAKAKDKANASARALEMALALKASADTAVGGTDALLRKEARERRSAMYRKAEADLRTLAKRFGEQHVTSRRGTLRQFLDRTPSNPMYRMKFWRGEQVDMVDGVGKKVPWWEGEDADGNNIKPDPTTWHPVSHWLQGFKHENKANPHVLAEKKRMIVALQPIAITLSRRNSSKYADVGPRRANWYLYEFLDAFACLDSSYDRLCYWFRRAWIALYTSSPREWREKNQAFLYDGRVLSSSEYRYGPRSTLDDEDDEYEGEGDESDEDESEDDEDEDDEDEEEDDEDKAQDGEDNTQDDENQEEGDDADNSGGIPRTLKGILARREAEERERAAEDAREEKRARKEAARQEERARKEAARHDGGTATTAHRRPYSSATESKRLRLA